MTHEQDSFETPATASEHVDPPGSRSVGCQPSLEEIFQYMDGFLDEQQQATLRSHFHKCHGCDDLYHFQAGLRQLLGTRCQSELPADLPNRVFRAITELP